MIFKESNMQERESKTNWHFQISLMKSAIRIFAGVALLYGSSWYLIAAGGMLIAAEILGIVEEF